jgi:hypothetical protein
MVTLPIFRRANNTLSLAGIAIVFAFVTSGVLTGCGTDHRPQSGDDTVGPSDDGGDDGFTPPDGYARLVGRSWELPAGANIYRCVRLTVPEDMYITDFVAQTPKGGHHAVLSIAGGFGTDGPDGDDDDCAPSAIGAHMLYASSVGTAPLQFPAGVGIKVTKGQQLHLNLHLFNAGDDALTGESAIWIKSQPTPPAQLAEMVLAGPIDFRVPSDNQPHPVSGICTARHDYSLFAIWPHMHQFGTHQTVELLSASGAAQMLHDAPFHFDDQSYQLVSPMVQVRTGDKVRVTCTYVNNSGADVTYGDGGFSEMCFAGLYRFPAIGSDEYCPN